ncbi:MAG: hypothetical protein GTO14_24940 [Anaerolineales bacterium]|nr:hypothetical protein [Anaerolineales bacterium]
MSGNAHIRTALFLTTMFIGFTTGCSTSTPLAADRPTLSPTAKAINRARAEEIAWAVLEPISTSEDRANWLVLRAEEVKGREVEDELADLPSFGCFHEVVPNPPIERSKTYWYVVFKPEPATPKPVGRTPSPTEPPAIPEPFIGEARFLVDPESGEVVAQAIYCIVY